MANSNFKSDKFVEVLQEFKIIKNQNTYSIGSINLTDVFFFVKNENENYKILSTGQYQVVGTNLIIDDPAVISQNTDIQMTRVLSITASKYITDIVNLNALRDHYNILVDDFIKMMEFLRKSGIKSDSSSMNYVFPLLEEGQVFMKKGLGFEGKQIMDINTELQIQMNKALAIFETYINTEKKPQLDSYTVQKEQQLETYKESKKAELNTHTNTKKQEVTAHANIEIERIIATGIGTLRQDVDALKTKTKALEDGTTNLPKLTLCGYILTVE